MQDILCQKNLGNLKVGTAGPGYDRSKTAAGIVHFGPGAFHRAHQAVYTDDLLRQGATEWGICEVSINSANVRDVLATQDNLYTLAILDRAISHRVVGAIKEILVAPDDPQRIIGRLARPSTKVVSLTVTEKGYCLTQDGALDFENKVIGHDLKNPHSPRSAIGFLAAGLRQRQQMGELPFVPVSCDNLANNGQRLARAVTEFAYSLDHEFGTWVEQEVRFPRTMVDSITPATTDEIRESVRKATGLLDEWPVQRESFSQWVIEDLDGVELPPWQDVGATLTKDVSAYEATKLRVLNGLHSSLAFIGILAGFDTVDEAVNNEPVRTYLQRMLEEEIIPVLPAVEGLDKVAYGESVLARFENPAIRYLLSQIAWDSTQKIPFRILETIEDNRLAGKRSPRLCLVLAAWMKFICNKVRQKSPITDPLADTLVSIGERCDGSSHDVQRFLALKQVFPTTLSASACFRDDVTSAYVLLDESPIKVLAQQA